MEKLSRSNRKNGNEITMKHGQIEKRGLQSHRSKTVAMDPRNGVNGGASKMGDRVQPARNNGNYRPRNISGAVSGFKPNGDSRAIVGNRTIVEQQFKENGHLNGFENKAGHYYSTRSSLQRGNIGSDVKFDDHRRKNSSSSLVQNHNLQNDWVSSFSRSVRGLHGLIFICNDSTRKKCLRNERLPITNQIIAESVAPGTMLFLLESEAKRFWGIYRVESEVFPGDPGNALALQVEFSFSMSCDPIPEECFSLSRKDNYYYMDKFYALLNAEQVIKLCKVLLRNHPSSKQLLHKICSMPSPTNGIRSTSTGPGQMQSQSLSAARYIENGCDRFMPKEANTRKSVGQTFEGSSSMHQGSVQFWEDAYDGTMRAHSTDACCTGIPNNTRSKFNNNWSNQRLDGATLPVSSSQNPFKGVCTYHTKQETCSVVHGMHANANPTNDIIELSYRDSMMQGSGVRHSVDSGIGGRRLSGCMYAEQSDRGHIGYCMNTENAGSGREVSIFSKHDRGHLNDKGEIIECCAAEGNEPLCSYQPAEYSGSFSSSNIPSRCVKYHSSSPCTAKHCPGFLSCNDTVCECGSAHLTPRKRNVTAYGASDINNNSSPDLHTIKVTVTNNTPQRAFSEGTEAYEFYENDEDYENQQFSYGGSSNLRKQFVPAGMKPTKRPNNLTCMKGCQNNDSMRNDFQKRGNVFSRLSHPSRRMTFEGNQVGTSFSENTEDVDDISMKEWSEFDTSEFEQDIGVEEDVKIEFKRRSSRRVNEQSVSKQTTSSSANDGCREQQSSEDKVKRRRIIRPDFSSAVQGNDKEPISTFGKTIAMKTMTSNLSVSECNSGSLVLPNANVDVSGSGNIETKSAASRQCACSGYCSCPGNAIIKDSETRNINVSTGAKSTCADDMFQEQINLLSVVNPIGNSEAIPFCEVVASEFVNSTENVKNDTNSVTVDYMEITRDQDDCNDPPRNAEGKNCSKSPSTPEGGQADQKYCDFNIGDDSINCHGETVSGEDKKAETVNRHGYNDTVLVNRNTSNKLDSSSLNHVSGGATFLLNQCTEFNSAEKKDYDTIITGHVEGISVQSIN